MSVQPEARRSGLNAKRIPHKQLPPKLSLQQFYLLTKCRLRNMKLNCGF
jgi:hypothetical protein